MNDYILSVLLGIVEGLTEFLPVSSTAHLRLVEAMLHVDLASSYWKMYTVVIQLGAILALVLLFTGRILEFFRTFPEGENGDRTLLTHPLSLTMVAFVCTAVPSLLLIKVIGKHLESVRVMALSLLIGGIVMWVVDALSVRRDLKTRDVEQMSLFQAIWIGLWEVTSAVFPGVSRSMSTIAAGQAVGMTRTAALEFSFLLSIPVMVAATGYEFLRTIHPKQVPGRRGDGPAGDDHPRLDRAGHRLCRFLCRCARRSGVVPAMGAAPRFRYLCGLSYYPGFIAAGFWRQTCRGLIIGY